MKPYINAIVEEDMKRMFSNLSDREKREFQNSTILITGAAGFLGFYLVGFLARYKETFCIRRIICLDNFRAGTPSWINLLKEQGNVELNEFDVVSDSIDSVDGAGEADYIFHMASIASPTFYRRYPIETLDANVIGLRKLLDFYRDRSIRGFVFFSSSEIYGDAAADMIPTPENYPGNVHCQGPRACYDESKRFGETLCYLFRNEHDMPVSVIRPFNTYGPGMRLNDARVPADFAKAVKEDRDVVMYSDGSPTRCFCYVSDAVTGFIKCVIHCADGPDTFNIGMDSPEISVKKLAEIYVKAGKTVCGYTGKIKLQVSDEKDYLVNNPNRRCPDLGKARSKLGYSPEISVEQGVERFLRYVSCCPEEELIW